MTAWCVVMATATQLPWGWKVGFAVLGVVVSTRLWALVLGRAVAGGVYLTPEAVELQWGVLTARIPWADLEPAMPSGPVVGWGERGVPRTPGTTTHRSFPVQMATEVVDRPPARVVGVPTTYLALDATGVRSLVEVMVRSPHLRPHLGNRRSLEWHVEPSAG